MKIIDIKQVVTEVIRNLSAKQYEAVYEQDIEKRMSALVMKEVIDEYGGEIEVPTFEQLDASELYYMKSEDIRVEYNLIIDNKQSDLTIIIVVRDPVDGEIGYTLRDLHIL